LSAAVEDCIRRGAQRAGYKVRFKRDAQHEKTEKLSTVEQALLYRLAQETVTNICKHAQAETVTGSVEILDDKLKLTIADDGKGLDPALINDDMRGLRFMRQRADLIGATITWQRGLDDKGTVVVIEIGLAGKHESTDH
jgi:signal transduction histidine kinase